MEYMISPTVFVMAMQVIRGAAICHASGSRLNENKASPTKSAFMDDTKILTPDTSHAHGILARLGELISWCRMSSKQNGKKPRNLSIVKGKYTTTAFTEASQVIPTMMNEPVKIFGSVSDASVTKMQYNIFEK